MAISEVASEVDTLEVVVDALVMSMAVTTVGEDRADKDVVVVASYITLSTLHSSQLDVGMCCNKGGDFAHLPSPEPGLYWQKGAISLLLNYGRE